MGRWLVQGSLRRFCKGSSPTGDRELPDGPWREATMSLVWKKVGVGHQEEFAEGARPRLTAVGGCRCKFLKYLSCLCSQTLLKLWAEAAL